MKTMHITRARASIVGGLLAAAMILLPGVPSAAAKPASPVIASFSPNEGWTTGGDTVVIKGSGLTNTSAVSIAGISAKSFKVASDGEVDAVTNPGPDGATGKVTVTTGSGRTAKTATSAASFRYTSDVDPTDPCVDIASGPGPTVSSGTTPEFDGTIAVTNGSLCSTATYTWAIRTPDGQPINWTTDPRTNCIVPPATTTATTDPTNSAQVTVTCTGSTGPSFDLKGFFNNNETRLQVRAELYNATTGQSDTWPEPATGLQWEDVCNGGCGFGMT